LLSQSLVPTPEGVDIAEHVVDAERDVILRVMQPPDRAPGTTTGCVLDIHGGGYVIGNRLIDDGRNAGWAIALGCPVASVEYRLAPDHAYPAAIDDCYDALVWLHEHADELGVDPARIGVAGTSAGGGLAAALALRVRARGGPSLAFQFLDSPMLDDRRTSPSSRQDGLLIWSRESNAFGWAAYLGSRFGGDDVPDDAAPARAEDLSGLPPALVTVGSIDGFRDEDIAYAVRLNQAGVPTELHVYPGAPHGFTMFGGTAVAQQADDDAVRWLARQLGVDVRR